MVFINRFKGFTLFLIFGNLSLIFGQAAHTSDEIHSPHSNSLSDHIPIPDAKWPEIKEFIYFENETCQFAKLENSNYRVQYEIKDIAHYIDAEEFVLQIKFNADGGGEVTLFCSEEDLHDGSPLCQIHIGPPSTDGTIRLEIKRSESGTTLIHSDVHLEILPEHEYRQFDIYYHYDTGRLTIYLHKNDTIFLDWTDPKPLPVKYVNFAVHTHRDSEHDGDAVAFNCTSQTYQSDSSELRTSLLQDYDHKHPPTNSTGPIKVYIGMIVTHFELDEAINLFQANVWFSLSWTDSRLSWDRSKANDSATTLRFSTDEIWRPDITLINNADPTETEHYGDSLMIVKPDGSVLWTPPAKLASHCSMVMIRWPYDEHTCSLKIGSWTHSGKEIDLEVSKNIVANPEHAIDLQLYIPNSEWSLTSTNIEKDDEFYPCCQNPYAVVKYSFNVKRNSPSYAATVIVPIFVITIVNIMVFILPPTAGEKITLASCNLVIVCFFLIYFELRLPSLGDHLPLLVLLYSINAVLIGISLIVSVVVINLSRNRKASSPPQCFRLFCNASFAQFLGLGYIVPYVSQTHSRLDDGVEMRPRENGRTSSFDVGDKDTSQLVTDPETSAYMANVEWILLAAMIDRLTLIIYSIVTAITLGLCLS